VLLPARNPTSEGELEYSALSHLVLLVQPHSALHECITYLVDVGFGGTGPLRPILLADGSASQPQQSSVVIGGGVFSGGWVWGTYPPERHRLIPGAFLNSSLEVTKGEGAAPLRDWHLQVSHAVGMGEWKTLYTFTDKVEFKQWDIDASSLAVSKLRGAIFHRTIVCMRRFLAPLDPEYTSGEPTDGLEELEWIGKWSLEEARATKRVGGKVLEERKLRSERERLEVIRDLFGIGVSLEDAQWIVGSEAELPVSTSDHD